MGFNTEFVEIPLADLHREAAVCKAEGWRFMQTHAVNGDDGIDLYYSFMRDGLARNLKVTGVKDEPVPSITDMFLAAFVFENEARELFGVNMQDIAIDFHGALYAPAVAEPMTIISPEMKAAREKVAKAAAAKAAKAAVATGGEGAVPAAAADAAEAGKAPAGGRRVFVMTPELQARLDAKLPSLSEEKRAKVEAALAARAAEAQSAADAGPGSSGEGAPVKDVAGQKEPDKARDQAPGASDGQADTALEAKLAAMDPARAAKVRAALAGKAGSSPDQPAPRSAAGGEGAPLAATSAGAASDPELEAKIAAMDPGKAAKVRAALKGGN